MAGEALLAYLLGNRNNIQAIFSNFKNKTISNPPPYLQQLAALYQQKKLPHLIRNGVFWQVYHRIAEPRSPYAPGVDISQKEAQQIRKELGAWIIRWLGPADWQNPSREKDWYVLLATDNVDLADLNSKKRKKLQKAQRTCPSRLLDMQEMMEQGYEVYVQAHQRYQGFSGQLMSKARFLRELEIEKDFPELVQYSGVFYGEQLIGYSKNYVFGKEEVNFAVSKLDPAFLKYRSAQSLYYQRNQWYLEEQQVAAVCSGQRNIEHHTQVQEVFVNDFNYKKVKIPLHLAYAPKLSIPLSIIRPFGKLVKPLHPKLKSLLTLDQFAER